MRLPRALVNEWGVETKLCSPLGAFTIRAESMLWRWGGAFHVAGIAFCTCGAFLDFAWQAQ